MNDQLTPAIYEDRYGINNTFIIINQATYSVLIRGIWFDGTLDSLYPRIIRDKLLVLVEACNVYDAKCIGAIRRIKNSYEIEFQNALYQGENLLSNAGNYESNEIEKQVAIKFDSQLYLEQNDSQNSIQLEIPINSTEPRICVNNNDREDASRKILSISGFECAGIISFEVNMKFFNNEKVILKIIRDFFKKTIQFVLITTKKEYITRIEYDMESAFISLTKLLRYDYSQNVHLHCCYYCKFSDYPWAGAVFSGMHCFYKVYDKFSSLNRKYDYFDLFEDYFEEIDSFDELHSCTNFQLREKPINFG